MDTLLLLLAFVLLLPACSRFLFAKLLLQIFIANFIFAKLLPVVKIKCTININCRAKSRACDPDHE